MTVSNSNSGKVIFEISYTGSTKYQRWGGWDISVIDVKFKGAKREISADINEKFSPGKEQLLKIKTRTISDNPIQNSLSEKTVDRICLSTEHAKTLELSVRIFQTYEDRYRRVQQSDGTWKGELRAKRDNLPVFIHERPKFEDGKCYRIQVKNQGEDLNATFTLKDIKTSDQERQKQETKAVQESLHDEGVNLINQGLRNLSMAFGNSSGLNEAVQGMQSTIAAYQQRGQANSELDKLDTSELHARFDAANVKLDKARAQFNQALATKDQEIIVHALSEKQKISKQVMELANALERKGVTVENTQTQNGCATQ